VCRLLSGYSFPATQTTSSSIWTLRGKQDLMAGSLTASSSITSQSFARTHDDSSYSHPNANLFLVRPSMIQLSRTHVDAALPRIAKGLEHYLWLRNAASRADFFDDKTFRRRFNHFYRIRRGPGWQNAFYSVMSRAKTEHLSFETILELLHKTTG